MKIHLLLTPFLFVSFVLATGCQKPAPAPTPAPGDGLDLTTSFITNSKTPGSSSQCASDDPNSLGYGVLCNTTTDAEALQDAALYAWRQFIGLNYPSDCTDTGGNAGGQTCRRGQPSVSNPFGFTGNAYVWETYFHKTEAYPGADAEPLTGCTTSGGSVSCSVASGYTCTTSGGLTSCTQGSGDVPLPTGCTASGDTVTCDFQTATPPIYQYTSYTVPASCAAVDGTAFVNLDETNQIGRAEMFAAASDPNGEAEEEAHLIRFLAKLNQDSYDYSVENGLYNTQSSLISNNKTTFSGTDDGGTYSGGLLQNAAAKAIDQTDFGYGSPVTGLAGDAPEVFFPAGSIEVKTAWRKLDADEASDRFLTSTVRYYQDVNGDTCPVQETWAMQALHIIQRPVDQNGDPLQYFTFATFGQIDNILTSDNVVVEAPSGALNPNVTAPPVTDPGIDNTFAWAESVASGDQPSDPTRCQKASTLANGNDYYYCVQDVELSGETTEAPTCDPSYQLYYANNGYENSNGHGGDVTPQGPICFTNRWNPIPEQVQAVNEAVQQLFCNGSDYVYDSASGRYSCSDTGALYTLFAYYRLTGVQWVPISRKNTDATGEKIVYDSDDAMDDGVYYLANEVVETDFNLQNFSGGQFPHVDALQTLGFYTAELNDGNYSAGQGVGLISDFGVGVPYPDASKNVDQLQGISSETFTYDSTSGTWTAYNMGGCMGCHGVAQLGGTDFSFLAGGSTGEPDVYDPDADYSKSMQNGEDRAYQYD